MQNSLQSPTNADLAETLAYRAHDARQKEQFKHRKALTFNPAAELHQAIAGGVARKLDAEILGTPLKPTSPQDQKAALLSIRIMCVLSKVKFPGYRLFSKAKGATVYLQAECHGEDNYSPHAAYTFRTRKWLMSEHMTDSEIVSTAFMCILSAIEHEAREQFTYKDMPVFAPHYSVDDLADLCARGGHEAGARGVLGDGQVVRQPELGCDCPHHD